MKIYSLAWWLTGIFFTGSVYAQWQQNDDTGPYDYNDKGNWTNGIVSGTFSGTAQPGLTVTFDVDTTVSGIYLGNSNTNISFRGEDGDRTLTLTGSINAPGNNGARTYTFGSVADGQRLAIDLSGGDRTVNTAQGRVITFMNEVKSSGSANGIIKTGAGALILTNPANTFGGKVAVSGGRVAFSSIGNIGEASALGQGGVIELSAGGTAAANTIKLQFGGDGLTVSADAISNRVITLVGSGTYFNIDNQSGHTLTLTANFDSAATGAAGKTFTISGNSGSVTEISGVIGNASADGATAVAGGGQGNAGASFVLRLSNTANTFSGAFTTGYDTIVEVTKLADQGTASSLGTGAVNPVINIGGAGSDYGSMLNYIGADDASTDRPVSLEFRRNSTNVIANNSAANANLSFTNSGTWTVTKNAAAGTIGNHTLALQGTSTGTSTVNGVITDYVLVDSGSTRRDKTSLTVNSAGVWRLTNDNTFTGNTTVSGGTLLVDGALAGTGAVTVSEGGALGGSGTINTSATVSISGLLTPGGVDAVGTLTLGALQLLDGAVWQVDWNSDTQTADLLDALGTVNLGDSLATLSAGADWGASALAAGTSFTILQAAGGLSGHFANEELQLGDDWFAILYTADAVRLTIIPEPGAVAMLALGGAGLLLLALRGYRNRNV